MVMSKPTATTMTRDSTQTRALPRHQSQRGEHGYRTPAIEDEEHPNYPRCRNVQQADRPNLLLHGPNHGPRQSSSSSPEHILDSEKSPRQDERNRSYRPESFPENLNWRQRIKHVTWAYFTLTMATGGTRFSPNGQKVSNWTD